MVTSVFNFQRSSNSRSIVLLLVAGATVGLMVAGLPLLWAAAGIAAMLAAAIVVIRPQWGFYSLIGSLPIILPYSLPKLILAAAAGSTVLWILATRQRLLPKNDRLLVLMGAFVGTVWLSGITATKHNTLVDSLLKYTGFIVLYWLIVTMASSRQTLRNAVWSALAVGIVGALYGLVQLKYPVLWVMSQFKFFAASDAYIDDTPVSFQGWHGQFRIESFTSTPDVLAYTMAVLIPFAFFWAIRQENKTRKLLGLSLVLLFLAVAALTFSRGAVAALAVMALAIAVRFPLRNVVPVAALGILLVVVSAVVYEPLGSRLMSIVDRPTEETAFGLPESSVWRLETNRVGVTMLLDHLLRGAGAGQQEFLWEDYAPELVPASVAWLMPLHNTYLLAGIELGGVGLLALVALLIGTFKVLYSAEQRFKAAGDKECLYTTWAVQVSLIGLLVAGLFSPILKDFSYFWAMIGFTGALNQISLAEQRQDAIAYGDA